MSNSDWEVVNLNNKSPNISKNISEWELNTPSNNVNNESLWASLGSAIPRIGSDVGQGLYGAYKAIPEYYKKGKSELSGLPNTLMQHPGHVGSQLLAGSQEAVNSIAQLPLNISKYLGSQRLHLLPNSIENAMTKITPQDTTQAINELFGEPKYPGEAALRGTVRNIPAFSGGMEVANVLKPITNKSIVKAIQKPHDILEKDAAEGFKEVSKEVKNRQIPSFPVSGNFIDNLRDYFPKTDQAQKLLDDAKIGDYDSLRKVQSELFTRGKKNLQSDLETDRIRGEEMFDKRNIINKGMSDHLNNSGHPDLANILQKSRNDYRALQETYYNRNMNKSIQKLVDKDIRKVPKNLTSILKEDSIPMKKFLDFHPGLEMQLKKYLIQKSISSKAKKYGGWGLSGLAAGEGFKASYDKYKEGEYK